MNEDAFDDASQQTRLYHTSFNIKMAYKVPKSRLVLMKHVFPTLSRHAKITISSYEILSCEILILAFLDNVGNTCLISTRRDII